MDKKNIIKAVIFVGIIIQFSCNSNSNLPPITNKIITAIELKSDFALLKTSLQEGHPGLYRYSSKEKIDSLLNYYETSINKEMTEVEALRFFAKVVAIIKDGHTQARPSKNMMDHIEIDSTALLFIPLMQNDTMYVQRNYSDIPDKDFLGARIISINGTDVKDLVKEFNTFCPVDGNNLTRKSRLLEFGRLFIRYLYYLQGYHTTYEVKYIPYGSKELLTSKLIGVTYDDLIEKRKKFNPNASKPFAQYIPYPDIKTGYIKIDAFDKDVLANNGVKDYPLFLKNTFETIANSKTENLILDLRDNLGGEDEYGKLLGAYFLQPDFDYYESIQLNKENFNFFKYTTNASEIKKLPDGMGTTNPDGTIKIIKHPNIGKQKPLTPAFEGKLYVLINGGCFSTTSELLTFLHYNVKPIFIGEESGGGYYGNCSGPTGTLLLPNSKLRVEIPIMKYTMAASGYAFPDRGVLPNYTVIPTIEDAIAKKDPELEKAFELIKNK